MIYYFDLRSQAAYFPFIIYKEIHQNMKRFWFIWFQSLTDYLQENVEIKRFQTLVENVMFFENENECEIYITNLFKNDKIIFIINGKLIEKVLPHIHELPQIVSIYIYYDNQEKYEEWTTKYKKELIGEVLSDYNEEPHETNDGSSSIFIFNGHSTNELNGAFIHSQVLINCLIRLKPNEKDEFISFCKKYFTKDEKTVTNLAACLKNYSKKIALECYIMNNGLFDVLNKALRNKEIDLLYHLRFFLRDIAEELQGKQCKSSFRVYRGQFMSSSEMKRLKNSVGNLITTNALFSTTHDYKVATWFCSNDSEYGLGVIFEIEINSALDKIKPFADLTPVNFQEKEVLFMEGTIFKLDDVCFNEATKIWNVKLRLCFHNDEQLEALMNHMIDQSKSKEVNLYLFGNILRNIGLLHDAKKYYNLFLEESSDDHDDKLRCYYSIGIVADEEGNYEESLNVYKKALQIGKKSFSNKNHSDIAEIYYNMAIVYHKTKDNQKALNFVTKALTEFKRVYGKNSLEVARCYNIIGHVYQSTRNYSKSHDYYQKALPILQDKLPPNHLDVGRCQCSLGNIDLILKKFDLALEKYDIALVIYKKSCPEQHIDVAIVLENMGLAYEKKGYWQYSLAYLQKAKTVYINLSLYEHPTAIKIENTISRILSKVDRLKDNKSYN
ncbi:hypothetical protein I4U23_022295 [Adineta vaga]|nr:hypothetical protein I4U23_022295 [Adineta vaga]